MWLMAFPKVSGGLPVPSLTSREVAERLGIDVTDNKNARRSSRPFLPLPHTSRAVAAIETMLERLGLTTPDDFQDPQAHPELFSQVLSLKMSQDRSRAKQHLPICLLFRAEDKRLAVHRCEFPVP